MEVSGQLHASVALPQGKSPQNPLDRRLGGPQCRSGHSVEVKNSQPPPEFELRSSDRLAHSQSLYRLSHTDSNKFTDIKKSIPITKICEEPEAQRQQT
jgi:hypothetical protein